MSSLPAGMALFDDGALDEVPKTRIHCRILQEQSRWLWMWRPARVWLVFRMAW